MIYTNNSNDSGKASGGIGFWGALQIAFIVLKLLGKINWSWIWVFSPTWGSTIIIIVLIIIYFLLEARK